MKQFVINFVLILAIVLGVGLGVADAQQAPKPLKGTWDLKLIGDTSGDVIAVTITFKDKGKGTVDFGGLVGKKVPILYREDEFNFSVTFEAKDILGASFTLFGRGTKLDDMNAIGNAVVVSDVRNPQDTLGLGFNTLKGTFTAAKRSK